MTTTRRGPDRRLPSRRAEIRRDATWGRVTAAAHTCPQKLNWPAKNTVLVEAAKEVHAGANVNVTDWNGNYGIARVEPSAADDFGDGVVGECGGKGRWIPVTFRTSRAAQLARGARP